MVFVRLVRRDDVATLSDGPCRFWRLETTKVFQSVNIDDAFESFLNEMVHETDHELTNCNISLVHDVGKQQGREDQVQPTRAKKGHVRHSHIVKLAAGTTSRASSRRGPRQGTDITTSFVRRDKRKFEGIQPAVQRDRSPKAGRGTQLVATP